MALTGFNPDLVTSSINGVQNSYKDLMNAIITQNQSSFVGGMASLWACNKAQTFFGEYKGTIDGLAKGANQVFESVVTAMNSAAQRWASDTDSSWGGISFSSFSPLTIDVSSIMENIGGVRGIDIEGTPSVVNTLSTIESAANSALGAAKSAVSNCGFIGGAQEANLIDSLSRIQSNIDNAINEMKDTVKQAMDATVNEYADTKGAIEQAFNGQ